MKKIFISGLILLLLTGCGTTSKETIQETNPLASITHSANIKIESQQRIQQGFAYGYPNFIWKKYESYSWDIEFDKNVMIEELLAEGNKFATLSITQVEDNKYLFVANYQQDYTCTVIANSDSIYHYGNYVTDPNNSNFRICIAVKVSPN